MGFLSGAANSTSTLARLIAKTADADFKELSATRCAFVVVTLTE